MITNEVIDQYNYVAEQVRVQAIEVSLDSMITGHEHGSGLPYNHCVWESIRFYEARGSTHGTAPAYPRKTWPPTRTDFTLAKCLSSTRLR